MKQLFTALLFVTTSAFACPELQGDYAVCRSERNILIEGTALKVKKILVPGNTFYKFSFLADGNTEREEVFFPANGVPVKDSWVSSTGVKHERTISARCLSKDLLQARTLIVADGMTLVEETSQYYMQGPVLKRISRGKVGELRYTDFLDCE